MTDIPPAPAKSPILIFGLLALAGAVIALIAYRLDSLVAPYTTKPPRGVGPLWHVRARAILERGKAAGRGVRLRE